MVCGAIGTTKSTLCRIKFHVLAPRPPLVGRTDLTTSIPKRRDSGINRLASRVLALITAEKYDVLISDLNIGHPGDGFTVVSAMRRTQPEAVTLILTGYPAFESVLRAIREQVDDFLTKPTDVQRYC